MPAVRTPEASRPTRHIAVPRCSLPRREIGSATSITFDFGANHPFTCVPACNLSVYASQWLLPDTTQDSIRGCPAQALPRSPSQATELNALARRNPPRTGRAPFRSTRLSSVRQDRGLTAVLDDSQCSFGRAHLADLPVRVSGHLPPFPRLSRPPSTTAAPSPCASRRGGRSHLPMVLDVSSAT